MPVPSDSGPSFSPKRVTTQGRPYQRNNRIRSHTNGGRWHGHFRETIDYSYLVSGFSGVRRHRGGGIIRTSACPICVYQIMSSPETPQRVTRSMSSNPQLGPPTSFTSAGPSVPERVTSTNPTSAIDTTHRSNPFQVDLVIPFSIAVGDGSRLAAQNEIRQGYEELLRALEGEGGLRIASRPGRAGKGKEEVWVFVGAGEEKVSELVEREG